MAYKILLIRDGAHGDVLLTTPALHALRAKFPDAEISYLTKKSDGDVLLGNTDISKIYDIADSGSYQKIHFDLAIDFRDTNSSLPVNAEQWKSAYSDDTMRSDLKSRLKRMKEGIPFAKKYAQIAGVELPENAKPIICTEKYPLPNKPFIVVAFDSWWSSKAYPSFHAKQLLDLLMQRYNVVMIGTHGELVHYKKDKLINLICKTNVQQAAYIIKHADLFIGIDSLPIHIADALGTLSVSIWTSTEPKSILTNGKLDHPLISKEKCHPCFRTECYNKMNAGCYPTPIRIMEEVEKVLKNETRPVTYIAMPTMGQVEITTQAIKGLFEKKNELPFRLILIDNGSSPKDRDALIELQKKYNFTLKRFERNEGFVAATNRGIEVALAFSKNINHDYLLWLNNDVVIEGDGWLDLLVKASAGENVVGPEGSRLKEDFSHAGWMKPGGQEPHYVDGWCLFAPLRHYLNENIGMLDSNINIFSEDADWCIRAKRAGHDIKLVSIPVRHLKHKAYSMFPASDRCRESLKYMSEKYGTLSNALKPGKKEEIQKEPGEIELNSIQSRIFLKCVCGREDDAHVGVVDGFPIVKCSCGIQRVSFILNPELLAQHYDGSLALRLTDKWIKAVEKTQEAYWHELDKYDIKTMQRHGKFLDLGCNLGIMVERAKRFGWDAIGSDFAPAFVEKCKAKGLSVFLGSGLNGQISGPIQVITMFDVIEHDPAPLQTLKKAKELLDPAGFLALTTPDHGCYEAKKLGLKYEHIRPVEHIWHFTTATITRLIEEAGLCVDEIRHADHCVDYKGNRLFLCRRVV